MNAGGLMPAPLLTWSADATAEQIHEQRFVVQTMLTQMNELLQRSSTKMWCGATTPLLTECRGAVDEDRFQDSLELCVRFVESQQWLDQLELLGHPPQTEVSCDADTGTTRHATEQSHPDEHEAPELNGPGQQMAYVIVNAFLDNVTFESTDAERLI